MPYNWTYGVALSGLQFPLVTASGTLAIGYDTAQLSGSLSQNGLNWSGLTNNISGIPGGGVYSIASLTATEMTCNAWTVKIVSNSGCLPQILLGINALAQVSGLDNILTAISGCPAGVWIQPTRTIDRVDAVSGRVTLEMYTHSGATIPVVTRVDNLSGKVTTQIVEDKTGYSLVADQTAITIGTVNAVVGVSGKVTLSPVTHSGAIFNQIVPVSGLIGILTAISGVPTGVRDVNTATENILTSGTIGHDLMQLRHINCENLYIDKTYTPDRLYVRSSGANYSSYFTLADDANSTTRTRA